MGLVYAPSENMTFRPVLFHLCRALVSALIILQAVLQPCLALNPPAAVFEGPKESPASPGKATELAVGDFDGDGKPDLFMARIDGGTNTGGVYSITILLNIGGGFFAACSNEFSCSNLTSAAVGDLNGDGKADLALADSAGSILIGKGDGTFSVSHSSLLVGKPSVAIADINEDGKLDLITGLSASVRIAFGAGDGTFQPAKVISGFPVGHIAVADVNGDGRPDILGCGYTLATLTNAGNGSFALQISQLRGEDFSDAFAVGDLNGDGRVDIVGALRGILAVSLGTASGTFAGTIKTSLSYAAGGLPLVIADFNGDGCDDVVVQAKSGTTLLLSRGDGTFTPSPINELNAPMPLVTSDFNGDGKPDIAVAANSFGGVSGFLNATEPRLEISSIGGHLQISWFTNLALGHSLQTSGTFPAAGGWQLFPYPPVQVGNRCFAADWQGEKMRFYRLVRPARAGTD
jgi:hypothetical protein